MAEPAMGFFYVRKTKKGGVAMATVKLPKVSRWAVPIKRHPLRLTSLLYLREALLEERYEECAQMVEVAKEFGATEMEIRILLEDPRRVPRP